MGPPIQLPEGGKSSNSASRPSSNLRPKQRHTRMTQVKSGLLVLVPVAAVSEGSSVALCAIFFVVPLCFFYLFHYIFLPNLCNSIFNILVKLI